MIRIGSTAPNRNEIAVIAGTAPTGAKWDQYIPVVDDEGARLDLDNYSFELTFKDKFGQLQLRLGTVSGEILKTTDDGGDILRVFTTPDVDEGYYDCSFAAKNTSTGQIWLLGRGTVQFVDAPPAFA